MPMKQSKLRKAIQPEALIRIWAQNHHVFIEIKISRNIRNFFTIFVWFGFFFRKLIRA